MADALPDWPHGDAYAHLWARVPPRWSGVSVGPRWGQIILDTDAALAKLDPGYEIHQVKEKYGELRYYCSLDHLAEAKPTIRAAERRAARTCEECGTEGDEITNGPAGPNKWWRTLCPVCRARREATWRS